ncbi:hypothetical protein [Proteus terrae]|uniref:hypothetical protein n=1 Tax=Proteus terrae TaxID=1574161 RepID=UPI00301C708D
MYGYPIILNEYLIVYDESNNDRLIRIENGQLNTEMNTDKKYKPIFILGGIAYKKNTNVNFNSLKEILNLQNNITEMKFNHIAKGEFDGVLNSANLKKFLIWLLDNDLYIHYSALNTLYWSSVDIIDDVYTFLESKGIRIGFEDITNPFHNDIRFNIDYLKNALYTYIQIDKDVFLSFLSSFDYPDIAEGNENKFIRGLYKIIRNKVNSIRRELNNSIEFHWLSSLLNVLKKCKDMSDLSLTKEKNPHVLIKSFADFYFNRLIVFPKSEHLFDEEKTIIDKLNDRTRVLQQGEVGNHDFMKSEYYPIQVSDVVAGLFRTIFIFLEDKDIDEIKEFKKNINPRQKECLDLLKLIINKSNNESQGFTFRILPISTNEKYRVLFE